MLQVAERQGLHIVLTMCEHVGVRGRGKCSVVYEVWMVLVVCIKLDGVRWAGSSAYTACSTRFDEVLRVRADIAQPPHRGRCVMSTTSIVHTSVSCKGMCQQPPQRQGL